MKYFIAAVLVVLVCVMPASARVKNAEKPQKRTITGYLVDMNCAEAIVKSPKDKIEQKAMRHTLECNLDDMCAAAGYAVIANGILYKFNATGNTLALKYCKSISKKNDIKVDVVGTFDNGVLAVEDIHDAAADGKN